ncbi:MAG: flavin monoamine oxidase family protein [bacterium]
MRDVVVVGAGLAGLTAARRLVERGHDAVVVEAQSRVGGRTCAEVVDGVMVDVGGQWIGPAQRRMVALGEELGLATFPTYDAGRKVLDLAGRVTTYSGSIPALAPHHLALLQATIWRIDAMAARVPPADPWNAPRARAWDRRTLGGWMVSTIPSRTVRDVMRAAIRVIFGAEPDELSLLHALWYIGQGGGILSLAEIRDGAQDRRFVSGAHAVSTALAALLAERVRLGEPVNAVVREGDQVRVLTESGEHAARRVVIAVPPHMAARIRFEPGLPPDRDALMQRMPMGATVKFHAVYDRPFWRDDGLSGELVCTHGPVSVTFDNTQADGRHPALVGFSVGAAARILGSLAPDEQRRVVTGALVRGFGARAARMTGFLAKDWAADPWARGCPTAGMPAGVMGIYGPALRRPCGRVHWCGTETAMEWTGYMEGAVESGERVAEEVSALLG